MSITLRPKTLSCVFIWDVGGEAWVREGNVDSVPPRTSSISPVAGLEALLTGDGISAPGNIHWNADFIVLAGG